MKLKNFLVAAALVVAGTTAHATTISLNTAVAPETLASIPKQDFVPELGTAGVTHLYSGPMTLITSGSAQIKFTLVGAESGFQNTLNYNSVAMITEMGDGGSGTNFLTDTLQGQTATRNVGAGVDLAALLSYTALNTKTSAVLNFNSGDDEFGVFADSSEIGALTTFFLALDDDGGNRDDNHDDIIVRVDVLAPVPLPASGLLLLAGLGGAFGLRRLRAKA